MIVSSPSLYTNLVLLYNCLIYVILEINLGFSRLFLDSVVFKRFQL